MNNTVLYHSIDPVWFYIFLYYGVLVVTAEEKFQIRYKFKQGICSLLKQILRLNVF